MIRNFLAVFALATTVYVLGLHLTGEELWPWLAAALVAVASGAVLAYERRQR